MQPEDQIKKFGDFLEKIYKAELLERFRKGKESISLDFQELAKFDPELCDRLLETPEDTIKSAEIAIDNFDLEGKRKLHVRFKNFPESQKILIRNVRSRHLNKFYQVDGVIRQKSDVRPQVTSAKFECPSCGNIISILQTDKKFKEPSRCGCGRKGKFRLISKELIDAQGIVLEEDPGDLEGGEQPKRINVLMKDDLVSPLTEKQTNPGSKVTMTGIIKEVPILGRDGGTLTRFDIILECNYVESNQEDYSEINISDEEIAEINDIAKDPNCSKKLLTSVAPSIYGYDKIKEALLVQLVGGVRKVRQDGMITRGDMHILLIGDPGAGKCLAPHSKVMLNNGSIEEIKDLFEDNKNHFIEQDCYSAHQPISVISTSITGKSASMLSEKLWRRRSPKKIIQITTASGSILQTTEEHPFFTTNDALVLPIPAQNLKIGDYIACPRRIKTDAIIQTLPKPRKYSPSNNRVKFNIPDVLDQRFARFLGYLIGDGYVRYRKTTGLVSLTNNNVQILDDFENITRQLFNIKVKKRPKQGTGVKEYYFSSIDFLKLLESMDPCIIKDSANVKIPKICQKSPDHILRHFISALFECEAHVSDRDIQFTSKSKDLIEQLKMSLLRFNIQSQISPKIKCATNTINKTRRTYYELRISGSDVEKYQEAIGFFTEEKAAKLKIAAKNKQRNPNLDIIPNVNNLLKRLRDRYNKLQRLMGIPRTTFNHYEMNGRNPSRAALRKIAKNLKTINPDDLDIVHLDLIANSDIFWDRIKDIRTINSEHSHVYDLEVNKTHNFIANTVTVHNSQLLKRMAKVAPKARYVSGKGVSGAGLCVSPNSLIATNPGAILPIENVVEDRIHDAEQYCEGVWKKDNINDIKIQSLSNNLKIHAKNPKSIWKLKAPEQVINITLRNGRQIELTKNTKLLTTSQGKLHWKKSSELTSEDHIATPRKLLEGKVSRLYSIDLIDANPVIHNIKPFVKTVVDKLSRKYGNIRKTSKALNIRENQLYHHWTTEAARGNIKLNDLRKICEAANIQYKSKIKTVSLYNGKPYDIPKTLDKEFLYIAGLIAGDGDIRKNNDAISIRLSNSCNTLQNLFIKEIEKYNLCYDIQPASEKRPVSIRTSSKIFGQILISLGIPVSPKSSSIVMSENLLKLNNSLLSEYIAGLYDADGSVQHRKTKGSDVIDLTTCSEILAKQLQTILLRFNIHATLRIRPPSRGKIKGKFNKYVIEIRGYDQIDKFKDNIHLRHPKKQEKLKAILSKKIKPNPNLDIIPGIHKAIKKELQKKNISLHEAGYRKNLSSAASRSIINEHNLESLKQLANSDIYWEKIKSIEIKKPDYGYVYDLTVEDSHNFVVDGILVHNTASVVKDEFLNGWALEAGALPLSNKGMCMIDEMDKMSVEDRSAMHEGLEQQTISISKANIQATLKCETTVLAAANPKFGRFDPYDIIANQINLPPALINRFDLIFTIKDLPDYDKDEMMAKHILNLHQNPDMDEPDIPTDLLKKYLAYARKVCKPELTEGATEEIKRYYVDMRNKDNDGDQGIKSVPVSARQLEALVRLSEGVAKLRLSDKVTRRDAKKAIELMHYCLSQIGVDPETGKIDIDRIATGISASQRSHISTVRDIINQLEEKLGKTIPIEDITKEAAEKGIEGGAVDEAIEKLKRSGDIFEPKRGFVAKI